VVRRHALIDDAHPARMHGSVTAGGYVPPAGPFEAPAGRVAAVLDPDGKSIAVRNRKQS